MRHPLGGKPAHQQVEKASIAYQDQKNQEYNPAQHPCNEGPDHSLSSLQVTREWRCLHAGSSHAGPTLTVEDTMTADQNAFP